MSVNSKTGEWGAGGDIQSGGAGGDLLSEGRIAELQGQSAKEAIDSLSVDSPAVKLPIDEIFAAAEAGGDPGRVDNFFPGPMAQAFYWSNGSVVGIQGPVGSGKTTTLLKSRLRRAIEMPRSTIDGKRRYKLLVVRQTYRELWSTTIPSYLEVFPKDLGDWSGGRGDPVTHKMVFEDVWGTIEFTTEFMAFGDNIEASMRGIQTTDIWLNEADTVPVDVITTGIGRINRWPAREHFAGLPDHLRSYGQIVCDFNAPEEDNWAFEVFHDEERRAKIATELSKNLPEGVEIRIDFFNQPGFGDPGCENLQNLATGYYETQIALNKLAGRGDKNDRLVHNRVTYQRIGEPVWKREFNPRVHVSSEPLEFLPELPLRIGLDQGFKGAALIAQAAGFWRWRILAEMHFPDERLMAAVFGQRLRELIEERFPGARIEGAWADMAGEHGASQAADENDTWNMLVGQAGGFRVRPQKIGTNRLQPRLEAVRAALEAPLEAGEPALLIDPSCKYLRRGFEARYVWIDEVDKKGDKRKIPDKRQTEANVHDALQYLLLSGHRANGQSPYVSRLLTNIPGNPHVAQLGHNGGPPLTGGAGGLTTGWDVLNPYGGLQ